MPRDPATIRLQHTLKMVAGLFGFQVIGVSKSRKWNGAPGEIQLPTICFEGRCSIQLSTSASRLLP